MTDQLQTTKERQPRREHCTMPKHTPARTYLQSARPKTRVIPITTAQNRHNPVRTTSFDTSIAFVFLIRAQYLILNNLACQDIQCAHLSWQLATSKFSDMGPNKQQENEETEW